jgi:hypothetical protein
LASVDIGQVSRSAAACRSAIAQDVRRDAAEVPGEALRDRLQGGEAVAALADVAADHLAVEVVDGGERPAHALLGGEHARAVGA